MAEVPEQLKPYVFKIGNKLGGAKKGLSLKEYAKKHLAKMTDKDRTEYLNGLPRELIWRMSEGNPHQSNDTKVTIKPTPIMDVKDKNNEVLKNHSNKKDNILNEED